MDIKVNQAQPITQTETTSKVSEGDGQFKFTLISHIEEQNLQQKLLLQGGQQEAARILQIQM